MILIGLLIAIGVTIIALAGFRTDWNFDKMKAALVAFSLAIGAAVMGLWNAGVPTP